MPARKKSKYCSDQCGRNLASERIKLLIPKIQAMKEHPSVATIEQFYRYNCDRLPHSNGIFRIEKLKLKYATILEIRNDLETKFEKLEEVIAYSK